MKLRFAAILALAGTARAHSWIEEVQAISDNGSYYGDYGYIRGYMARTDPGFNGYSDEWLLPSDTSGRTRINSSDLLCHPSQRTSNYSSTYPKLQITADGFMAMKYLENGHVTLPQNQLGKPKGAGTVFVYATLKPSDTETIAGVLDWTTTGSGGDKRGTLISSEAFDDGRCHQINSGTISVQRQAEFPDRVAGQPTSQVEQWCESDVQIPSSVAKAGDTVTLYWVWQWPTAPGADPTYPTGKDEFYTSCLDVEVVDKLADTGAPIHTIVQQDPQTDAVSSYKSRTAYTESPLVTLADATGSSSIAASTTAAAAAVDAAAAALTTTAVAALTATTTASSSSTFYSANSTSSTAPSSSSSIYTSSSSSTSSSTPPNTLPYITYSLSYLPTYTTSLASPSSTFSTSTLTGTPQYTNTTDAPYTNTTTSSDSSGQASAISASTNATATAAYEQKTVTETATAYKTITASANATTTLTLSPLLQQAAAVTATTESIMRTQIITVTGSSATATVTTVSGQASAALPRFKRSAKFRLA